MKRIVAVPLVLASAATLWAAFATSSPSPTTSGASGVVLKPCHVEGVKEELRCGVYEVFENRLTQKGKKLPLKIVPAEVRKPDDLEAAFATLAGERAEALVVLQDSLFFSEHRRILALAAAARLPAIWTTRLFAEAGGLIGYGIDEADSFRRAASLIDKILKGAKPGELPIEFPTKIEMVINLKTAKELGVQVPLHLQQLADEVIE